MRIELVYVFLIHIAQNALQVVIVRIVCKQLRSLEIHLLYRQNNNPNVFIR